MIGLHITLLPDRTIKRHLSTEMGEVPLADTTVTNELISFTAEDHLALVKFTQDLIREIKTIYEEQNDYLCFCKDAYLYLVSQEESNWKEYCQWFEKATAARNRYLAGKLSVEEAISMIHVPTIQELREQICALSGTQT